MGRSNLQCEYKLGQTFLEARQTKGILRVVIDGTESIIR